MTSPLGIEPLVPNVIDPTGMVESHQGDETGDIARSETANGVLRSPHRGRMEMTAVPLAAGTLSGRPTTSLTSVRGTKQADQSQASPLSVSISALAAFLDGDQSHDAQIRTAVLLRQSARTLRERQPRHSAVLRTLADALTFTAADVGSRGTPLVAALTLLQTSFLPEEQEEDLYVSMIRAGWDITPAYTGRLFSESASGGSGWPG